MPARSALTARQREILQEMGIDAWSLREPAPAAGPAPPPRPQAGLEPAPAASSSTAAPALVPAPATAAPDWATLRATVRACERCELARGRTQTVFGVGHEQARWMIIGEAPGAEEDRQGEPFVGPAGQLLNEMLRAVGLKREDVFIANILKCRPPDNRDPRPAEIAACSDHLAAQLRLVAPRLILAVGRIAAQSLLRQEVPVGRLRGRAHAYGEAGTPLVVTYHPAYLLRSPGEKRKAWDDLRLARRLVPPAGP